MQTSLSGLSAALKEWGSVTRALDLGIQTILFRKGGIADRGREFKVKADQFLFFPTYEHQDKSWLKPSFQSLVDESNQFKIDEQKVAIRDWARIIGVIQVHETRKLDTISEFHIWTDGFVRDRLSWNPGKPLKVILLKVYRLPNDHVIDVTPKYRGCLSWITLSTPISTEGSQPVLQDEEFESRREKIMKALTRN